MKRKDDGIDVDGRAPGFFLYPADLERELRPLPVGAKACWVMMFLRMHFSKRRGYLEHETGRPFSNEDVARLVGISTSQANRYLDEMEHTYGTFSRDENGVIFNRRMVKDTAISEARKIAGKSGGNPVLLKQKSDLDKQNENLDNQKSNQNGNRGSTRARTSTSTSFSTSSSVLKTTTTVVKSEEYPLTAAAVRGSFPETDDAFIARLTIAIGQKVAGANGHVKGDVTDALMAEAVEHCRKRAANQTSAGLFLRTVPQCVLSWLTLGKGSQSETGNPVFNPEDYGIQE